MFSPHEEKLLDVAFAALGGPYSASALSSTNSFSKLNVLSIWFAMTKWALDCERSLPFDFAFCKELQDMKSESKYLSSLFFFFL